MVSGPLAEQKKKPIFQVDSLQYVHFQHYKKKLSSDQVLQIFQFRLSILFSGQSLRLFLLHQSGYHY